MNTYDANRHIYKSVIGRLPGATDVIKSEGLINPLHMSEDARWRGKCVHMGVELLLRNELDWDTVDQSIEGYIRSAEKFIKITGFQVLGGESACFDLAFGCMPDVWGVLHGCNSVVEFKTGAVPAWAAIQTALQARALKSHHNFNVQKRFGLRLMPDGTLAKLQPFEDPNDDNVAMSMVQTFHWKAAHRYIEDWKY